MKKSLAHLPKHKREELKLVTEIILDECPTILMVILFGSYARGDWVEDTYVENGITYEYASDFDILVIVRPTGSSTARTLARRRPGPPLPVGTWTDLIVESIETINNALATATASSPTSARHRALRHRRIPTRPPRELTKNARAKREPTSRSGSPARRILHTTNPIRRSSQSAAGFIQATERFYGAILLVSPTTGRRCTIWRNSVIWSLAMTRPF
jgi:predicted nucleotidyltransferase